MNRRLLASPAEGAKVMRAAPADPGPDEFSLRVLRAGLCGTDVQIARGERPDKARVLGHEGLAVGLTGAVIPNPVHAGDQDEILGHSYDGLFQDRVLLRRADDGGPDLCPAEPSLPADLAPLAEPLGTVLYAHELLATARPPRSLVIFGGGVTAALNAIVATARGIETHLVHARAARLAWLEERGLTGGATTHVATAKLAGSVDAAVLCVPRGGAHEALSQAVACVRPDGVIDLFGGFRRGDRHPLVPEADLGAIRRANVRGLPAPGAHHVVRTVRGHGVRLTGHRGTSVAHIAEAQRMLVATPHVFAPLVTSVVSLEQLALALRALACERPGVPAERGKIVVDLTMEGHEVRDPDLLLRVADLA